MKVSDIRTGMRVTLRNGETYYAMLNTGCERVGRFDSGNILVHKIGKETGWMPLDYYNDSLEYHDQYDDDCPKPDSFSDEAEWDIVKVEAVNYAVELFCPDSYHTIWKREA